MFKKRFFFICTLSLVMMNNQLMAHPSAHIIIDPTKPEFNLSNSNVSQNNLTQSRATNNSIIKDNSKKVVPVNVVKQPNVKPVIPISAQYRLSAVSQIANNYRALINNQWVEKGQVISNAQIIEVDQDKVLIQKENKIYELTLPKKQSVFKMNKNPTNEAVGGNNE